MRAPHFVVIAANLCAALGWLSAGAQDYPGQTVRIVVPFPPGGSADLSARTVSEKLSETLGKPVLVDNRPGAGGQIGILSVVRAPADGHTLLLGPSGPISVTGHVQKLPYDTARDLAPVAMLAFTAIGIAVNASLPVRSLRELVDSSRGKPGGLNYSVPGLGTLMHLAGELLRGTAGATLVPIPYKGNGPAVAALLSGEVPAGISDMVALIPHANSGRIRILAVTNSSRSAGAPGIQTVSELGYTGYSADGWLGLFAPTGTPRAIIARLNAEVARAIALPEVRASFLQSGLDAAPMNPDEMRRFVLQDIKKWGEVIKSSSVKIE